jgi:hypothetical protein
MDGRPEGANPKVDRRAKRSIPVASHCGVIRPRGRKREGGSVGRALTSHIRRDDEALDPLDEKADQFERLSAR